ncbi:MAG: glycoside hydrolase family 2 TIM barrel-domain containing protein [Tepidisphaeraceae bacterium]
MSRAIVFLLALLAALRATAADYVWIEGESPTSRNIDLKPAGAGNPQWLSGQQWLSVNIAPADVPKAVPKDGVLLGYEFKTLSAGKYEIWNRIGMEFIRSPFDWRIDDGDWRTILPTDFTTDLMELAVWNEVAWIKMGEVDLKAGPHRLQIRLLPRPSDPKNPDKGTAGILYCSDALCVYKGAFHPNGAFKPDADWQTDVDKQAAANVFRLKAGDDSSQRSEVSLGGLWEVCRWDETEVADRVAPVKALPQPAESFWRSIQVPGDKYKVKPELAFAHRLVYRTKVDVPAGMAGRSFFLRIPSVNLMASVLVNGQYCGWTRAPYAPFECDVSRAIKAGQVNEVCVVIKDNYYAFSEKKMGRNIRFHFNIPSTWMDGRSHISQFYDFPIGSGLGFAQKAGLLERAPSLVAAGAVYTTDVFAMPSVKNKRLGLEVTLLNPTAAERTVQVVNEIVPAGGGGAEKTFGAKEVKLAPGEQRVVKLTEEWANAKLWWPDEPNLYNVVTKVSLGGKVIDVRGTRFGFRQWEWSGSSFKLNGIKWQFFADSSDGTVRGDRAAAAAAVQTWKKAGQNITRFLLPEFADMTADESISFMDEQGIVVRRSGIMDAMGANYLHKLAEGTELFDNWIEQLRAQVKSERNHPSLLIWSIENEVTFINSRNLGLSDRVEPQITRVAQAVMAMDPTRPVMVDGGNCLMDKSLPVNGVHYIESAWRDYPDEAYTLNNAYASHLRATGPWGKQPWELVKDRPIFMGEAFFLRGYNPSAYSQFGGEACFAGRGPAVKYAAGLYAKMLSEGYRWHGVAATHFSLGAGDADLHHNSWQPVCALCREWNWTFAGGSPVDRHLKIFNSTHHSDPITFTWELTVGGKREAGDSRQLDVAPGEATEMAIRLDIPQVKARTAAQLNLMCLRGGKEVFRDTKQVAIIDPNSGPQPNLRAEELAVLDPADTVKARLTARGVVFTAITRFEELGPRARVLVIGKDALGSRDSTEPKWMSFAARGGRVLVLDQEHPMQHMAAPADLVPTDYVGRIAFAENPDHPIFAGLAQEDFFTWSGDHIVYRNVYRKATRGAVSLAHCDLDLGYSAITQCPVNDGLMLLCQLLVGTKLDNNPVAQRLFDNMLAYCASYAPDRKATSVAVNPAGPRGKLLAESGLKFDPADDVLAAISDGKHQIVVADATPAVLKQLAEHAAAIQAFTGGGGWLMLCGLTPEGLGDFNHVVGVDHLIRPFELERVMPAAVRDPLLSGVGSRDIAMASGEAIFPWAGDKYMVDDEFAWIVDLDDIAPFCQFPGAKAGDLAAARQAGPSWLRNTVNGFTSADAWKLIYYMTRQTENGPTKLTVTLPRPEEIVEFSIVPNLHYAKPVKVNLYFDDDPKPVALAIKPEPDRQDLPIESRKATKLTIELAEFDGQSKTTGIDNMWIKVKRSDGFHQRVKPLLNIGGLVRYPMGKGGVVLNQLNILERESVPENAQKKKGIVAAILRNMGAQFAGAKLLVAGEGLKYTPIALEERCNQHLTADRGWFDAPRDLRHLPVGQVTFGGVDYLVRDFKTSPLPSCIMLSGPGVKGKMPDEALGIPVGRKADCLFFLHAFKVTRNWAPDKADAVPPVLFKYVVHYADGKAVDVPVRYGEGTGHWIQKDPQGVKQAVVAWAAPFPNDKTGDQAVLYGMQWNNPSPGQEIKSIDLMYDPSTKGAYGVPALLGATAATRLE